MTRPGSDIRGLLPSVAVALLVILAGCVTTPGAHAARAPKAQNVILFLGDGMGISTITAARIFEGQQRGRTGEENSLSFEAFPNVALIKTYNLDRQVPVHIRNTCAS